MAEASYGSLPFAEQIAFFRSKIPQGSYAWTDLWQSEHDRGFVVAGATRDALVLDLKAAVDKAISQGTTLQQFRKDFDAIVQRRGWAYNGGRNWRTRVIYNTNLRTSYAAGRYKQMLEVAESRPYWRYRHTPATDPREQHLAWDGLILPYDDPWWGVHYPPNGWGCGCYVETLADRDLQRLGRDGPDPAPQTDWRTVRVGERGPSPRTVRVPEGVDPGWAYAPGRQAWHTHLAERQIEQYQAARGGWQRLVGSTWQDYDRPEQLPLFETAAPLATPLATPLDTAEQVTEALRAQFGADYQVFDVAGRAVTVDAEVLGQHIDPARAVYLPLLVDTLSDPWEVWLSPERHEESDAMATRMRVIKAYRLDDKGRAMLVVAQENEGYLEAWTFIPISNLRYANKQREGMLIYAKP